jgi:hypothetical protein
MLSVSAMDMLDVQLWCHQTKGFKIFHLPSNTFVVDIKYEMRENKFVNLPKSKLTQFSILIDLATTGHKLQGMTKKNLIVSSLNYGTSNCIYVVLSRVTSIKGLSLLQPLKLDFPQNNPGYFCKK